MLCTSYDDLVKYGNILANLHKGNITADSSAQEIAAASVGTKLDKNGKPIITSPKQGLEYTASLRKSKGLFADVSSGAAVNGDGAPVGDTPKATKSTGNASSGTNPQGNNTTAQTGGTVPYTGTSVHGHSEDQIHQMENDKGTFYVFYNIYGGDINKYDPYKRASELTGIPLEKDGKTPVNCGSAGKEAFNSALYGESSGSNNAQGGVFDNKEITAGTIYTDDPRVSVGIYKGNSYSIVEGDTPSHPDDHTLTQEERDYLVYLALHEAGGIGGFPDSIENPEAQLTAVVSTFMNAYEVSYYSAGDEDNLDGSKTGTLRTFNDAMAIHCTRYASEPYVSKTLTANLRNGDYSGLDFSGYTDEQIACAEKAVNTVLSGTRNTNATGWRAAGNGKNKFLQDTFFPADVQLQN